MSYCLSIKLDSGIVFASDSRTSAGVDNISSYSKMHTFATKDDRFLILLSVGNLGTTQAVVNLLRRDLEYPKAKRNLNTFDYIFDAAHYVGQLSCEVQKTHCDSNGQSSTSMEASFILGGQIKGREHDTLLIYPEGNYISASASQPYLQIGETKYGKPILDRIITNETTLEDGARCALVSLDSTMRSNLSVGPPIEMTIYKKDSLKLFRHNVYDARSPFFEEIETTWREGLNRVFHDLPRFDWE
ncbi:MAG: peptidase [Gammaproteobacteria bacterium]|jgi:putative proteasome-type protease